MIGDDEDQSVRRTTLASLQPQDPAYTNRSAHHDGGWFKSNFLTRDMEGSSGSFRGDGTPHAASTRTGGFGDLWASSLGNRSQTVSATPSSSHVHRFTIRSRGRTPWAHRDLPNHRRTPCPRPPAGRQPNRAQEEKVTSTEPPFA